MMPQMSQYPYLYYLPKSKLPKSFPFLLFILVAIIICILIFFRLARAEEYSDAEIANAIFKAEGGTKAQYAYGIRSVKYSSIAEARRICLQTIINNRRRYALYGYKQYPDFLSFLQSRYCPTKGRLSKPEKRLNKYWLLNLRYQLSKL